MPCATPLILRSEEDNWNGEVGMGKAECGSWRLEVGGLRQKREALGWRQIETCVRLEVGG